MQKETGKRTVGEGSEQQKISEKACYIVGAGSFEKLDSLPQEGDLVIAADTVVSLDGEILGKPGTEDKAREMLKKLSGRSHKVFTGVTLRRGDMEMTDFEETEVFFREISESEIGAYIRTGEPLDKAGAYGIQGAACSFVYRLEGDYYNVMGLPMAKLCTMLKVFGVEMLK